MTGASILRRYDAWWGAAAALLLDLGTKASMVAWLAEPPHTIPVLPVFSLTLGFNPGISFGLFSADTRAGVWALLTASVAVMGFVAWLAHRSADRMERSGCSLVLDGALGNVLDRLHDGYVTDFLDFHLGGWRFPAFNAADIAINCGVLLIIIATLRTGPARTVENRAEEIDKGSG